MGSSVPNTPRRCSARTIVAKVHDRTCGLDGAYARHSSRQNEGILGIVAPLAAWERWIVYAPGSAVYPGHN